MYDIYRGCCIKDKSNWFEISERLKDDTVYFSNIIQETYPHSYDSEIIEMFSGESFIRFSELGDLLSKCVLVRGKPYENALLLNSWIILGSLAETALQMFLAIYLNDYKKENWQMWENIQIDLIEQRVLDFLNQLKEVDLINSNQRKSLKEAIYNKLKEHTKEHKIEKITLDELIQIYIKIDILDKTLITKLNEIKENRNGIHSFQKRKIDGWDELKICCIAYLEILYDLSSRLPDVPY